MFSVRFVLVVLFTHSRGVVAYKWRFYEHQNCFRFIRNQIILLRSQSVLSSSCYLVSIHSNNHIETFTRLYSHQTALYLHHPSSTLLVCEQTNSRCSEVKFQHRTTNFRSSVLLLLFVISLGNASHQGWK